MSQTDIKNLLTQKTIVSYLQKKGISHLYLFGSYAENNHKKSSDIDLLYEQDQEIGRDIFDIISYLENKTSKKIDFVSKNHLNHRIKDKVLSQCIALF